ATVSAYVMLKGQPDPTIPNDPSTGQEQPAKADKVVQLPAAMNVHLGTAPRFVTPLDLDSTDLTDFMKDYEGAYEATEVSLDDCGGATDLTNQLPDKTDQVCIDWKDKDGENLTTVILAIQGNYAIGFYGTDW